MRKFPSVPLAAAALYSGALLVTPATAMPTLKLTAGSDKGMRNVAVVCSRSRCGWRATYRRSTPVYVAPPVYYVPPWYGYDGLFWRACLWQCQSHPSACWCASP